jgi:spore germination protein KB
MFTLTMILTALCVLFVLLIALPDYNPSFLLPVLPKGIKPVLHGAFFTFGFPYAEVFLFSMLLPFVKKSSLGKMPRTMLITLGINIFILIISTISAIMIFGPFAGEKPYALFSLARVVEFQEIIQRVESIIGMSLILGSYMKTTITLYVMSLYLSKLIGLQDNRTIVMPLALIGFLMGLNSFDGAAEWTQIVTTVHPVWTFAAFVIPLLLMTVITLFKKADSPKT